MKKENDSPSGSSTTESSKRVSIRDKLLVKEVSDFVPFDNEALSSHNLH